MLLQTRTPLTTKLIADAMRVFDNNGWDRSNDPDFAFNLFDRFCESLEFFSPDQQELIIRLSAEYLHFPMNRFLKGFVDSFDLAINVKWIRKFGQ